MVSSFLLLLSLFLQGVASSTVKPPPSPKSMSDHELFMSLTKGIRGKYKSGQIEESDINKLEEDLNAHRTMNGTDLDDEEDDDHHVIQPRRSYMVNPGEFKFITFGRKCRKRGCMATYTSTTGFYYMCVVNNPKCFNPLTRSSPFVKINGINYCSDDMVMEYDLIQSPLKIWVKTSHHAIKQVTCYITSPQASTGVIESNTCNCGKLNKRTRIVGGAETEVHEYPHQVGLVRSLTSRNTYCAGSIIGKRWIVTAAHCIKDKTASDMFVLVGEHNLATSSETDEEVYTVSTVIQHPQFSSSTLDNDICLLELSEDIPFNSDNKVAPICLPTVSSLPDGTITTVTGWGRLSLSGSSSDTLMEVDVPIVERATCNTLMEDRITPTMICAGLSAGGKDACKGDSGGPLIYKNGAAHELVGLVSWGFGCANPDEPGVYADVMTLKSWILSEITTLNTCVRNTSD